jgi:leucyl aminopeptidase
VGPDSIRRAVITTRAQAADLTDLDADVVAVGVFKGGIDAPGAAQLLDLLGLDAFPVTPAFRGDVGQTLLLAAPGHRFGAVLLVGLGRMDEVSPARLRRVAGDVARATPRAARLATTLALVHPSRAAVEAVAEGLALGAHVDQRHRSAPAEAPDREAVLLVPSSLLADARAAVDRAGVVAEAVAWARDLVNTPPGELTPAAMAAEVAQRMPDEVAVSIRDEAWLAEQGCGGLLGVGRGSAAPPRLVELSYEPEQPLAHVVLAGKGITFDTGGLNLKPGPGMAAMKCDMAGAAAVAAALSALPALGSRIRVTGLLALAENAIGGDAQRPGDVLRTFDGTTVEVVHTDAEGRLVLADALGYGASLGPDAMVDLATLTGGCVTALGPHIAGVMGSDQQLVDDLLAAAAEAGEDAWPLPLPDDYDAWLESPVADLDNLGRDQGAQPLLGGLFLRRFTAGIPWAHVDMAGPAFLSKADARGHTPAGGTGWGVATLLAFVQRHSP